MMRRCGILALIWLIVASSPALATSIFSYHPRGLGYWEWRGDGRIMGMGGTSVAVSDMSNPVGGNPATLAVFEQTALTVTFLNQQRNALDRDGLRGTFYDQYPRLFRAVVPLGFGIVTSVGLEPLSDVRMIWSNHSESGGIPLHDSLETSGGLWAGTLQVGRAFGPLSVGARMQVARGNVTTEWRRTILESNAPLATSVLATRRFAGTTFGFGAAYRLSTQWVLGAYFDLPTTLDETDIVSLGTRIPSSVYPRHEDTYTVVSPDQEDTTTTTTELPLGFAFGASWAPNEHVLAAAEFEFRRWSQLDERFRNTWRLAFGVEVIPSTDFTTMILFQLPYRLGFRWEQHYIPTQVEGSSRRYPNGWFVTSGLGIPIGHRIGQINYSYEYGVRGSLSANLAREKVWRHTISVVGWERWFVRRPRR